MPEDAQIQGGSGCHDVIWLVGERVKKYIMFWGSHFKNIVANYLGKIDISQRVEKLKVLMLPFYKLCFYLLCKAINKAKQGRLEK